MPGSRIPSVEELQRPERLQDVLAKDKPEDCLPCKVTGAAAFIGLGTYSYYSGHSQLQAQEVQIVKSKSMFGMKSRQAGVTSIAMTLVGMGLWRLVN